MLKILTYGWEILKIDWKANGLLSIMAIFSNIYENTLYPFIQVFLLAQVLDLVQHNNNLQFSDFHLIIVAFVLASLVKIALTTFVNLQTYTMDVNLNTYLNSQIFTKLTTLDPATFESPEFQELLTQMEGIWGIMSSQLQRFIGLINAVVSVATAILVLFPLFPQFIPLVLLSVIPAYYFGDVARKKLWPFYTSKRSVVLRVTHYIRDLLSQDGTSKETAIFHTGPILLKKAENVQTTFIRQYNKVNKPFINKIIFSNILQLVVFLYTQYVNLLSIIKGTLGIGQFSLAFQQTLNLATSSQGILDMYSSMLNRIQQIDQYMEFINYPRSISSSIHPTPITTNPSPPIIEFKNVRFRYPKSKRDILQDFNVTLHPGEKLALVGENGAGKTTLIKLLLRFYDVTEGEILINGTNIKQISLDEWHKQVGALFQDFIKYQFTFKENVYFGDLTKENKEETLKEAIRKSGADAYLHDLPKRIDQVVGKMFDEGIDLSGGQWQKLALARAFYRNAPILILDEPTSAIDAKAEYEIFQNVQKLQQDKTVIIISHRFSTVRNADRILVLDDGKIIEEGNHETLMKKKGLYEELFTLQAKGYK
jgi:ATP-binding cassette, subfamily B, bacterial